MADVEITYKGKMIAQMDDSGTKIIETSGFYCEGDIAVAYNSLNESAFLSLTTTEVVIGANTVAGGFQALEYLHGLVDEPVALAVLLENPVSKDELVMAAGSAVIEVSASKLYRRGYRYRNGVISAIALYDDQLVTLREGARYKIWLLNANISNAAPY